MTHNDFEAYKKAVRVKYEVEKNGIYSSFLLQPSRANLRKLCIERFKGNKSDDDLVIYKRFFGSEFEEGNFSNIKKQTDRFRAIENFLKGQTDTNEIEGINLAAILVDFNPRPFLKFTKTNEGIPEEENVEIEVEEKELPQQDKEKKEPEKVPVILMFYDKAKANINNAWSSFSKQKKIALISVAGLFFAGYTAKDLVFPKKECMLWHEDHYVLVDCKSDEIKRSDIKPYDEEEFNRKKLKVCDTFTFFRNDEAIIWYSKKNNLVEFFNMDGKNPRNGCELKQVSQHMIDKYVPPCK